MGGGLVVRREEGEEREGWCGTGEGKERVYEEGGRGRLVSVCVFVLDAGLFRPRPSTQDVQAMIVWQKIDSMSADGVAVDVFLQGIIRMVQPLQGIDVAAMKSHMRRTLHEHAQLTADTTKCQESFMNIFDNLRQVHLTCQVEDGVKHREVRKELLDDTTKERRALLIHRNNTLKRRISVAKQHLELRRKTLSEIAPRATVLPGRQEEVSPLCSARVGFD